MGTPEQFVKSVQSELKKHQNDINYVISGVFSVIFDQISLIVLVPLFKEVNAT